MAGNLFPHKVTIQSKTTTNVHGAQVITYTNHYIGIAASVQPASAGWSMFYDRRNITISHSVFTAKQVSVNTGDIILFGTRRFAIRGTVNVLEVNRLYRIDCLEVQTTGEVVEGQ